MLFEFLIIVYRKQWCIPPNNGIYYEIVVFTINLYGIYHYFVVCIIVIYGKYQNNKWYIRASNMVHTIIII